MNEQVQEVMETPEQIEEKIKRWHQEEFVKVQKFCGSQGIQVKGIDNTKTRCLPPLVGLWYVNSSVKKEDYWVIAGDLATDLSKAEVAPNAREALKYFSMNWQLKAAQIEDAIAEGKITGDNIATQTDIVKELISKAEALYQIHSDEKLWKNTNL